MLLKIDSIFKSLIPSLTKEEYAQLEENIISDGCRDPLVVWDGIIVDGHNRYEICKKHNIEFATKEKKFKTRFDAVDWIINNQMGRRNINEATRAHLIGKKYENQKSKVSNSDGFNQYTKEVEGKSYRQPVESGNATSNKIADEYGITEKTVRNAGKFSQAVDSVANNTSMSVQEILSANPIQSDIKKLAKMEPEAQIQIITAAKKEDKPLKAALHESIKSIEYNKSDDFEEDEIVYEKKTKCPLGKKKCPQSHVKCDHWQDGECYYDWDATCTGTGCTMPSAKKPNAICPHCGHELTIDYDNYKVIR